jgi:hypothetical protein
MWVVRLGLCPESRERPNGVLAHHRVGFLVASTREHIDVIRGADVAEHHGGVALEPAQLRALHR